jgi:hypothetical protein
VKIEKASEKALKKLKNLENLVFLRQVHLYANSIMKKRVIFQLFLFL